MDPNATPPAVPEEPPMCTVCLDPVVVAHDGGATRSVALLQCGHKFHLDCIGSAFNAKGMMQCPNCRNIEEGNWLSESLLELSIDPYDVPNEVIWARVALADFVNECLDSMFQNCGLDPIISSGMEGDQTANLSNVQVFYGTEQRNFEIEQPNLGVLPMVDPANRLITPFGFDVPSDGSNQQRSTQSNSVAPLVSSSAVTSIDHGHDLRG